MPNKIKKYVLEKDDLASFDIIGICSAQSDFRLALQLNREFTIYLEKSSEQIEIPIKKTGLHNLFSFYSFRDPNNFISYFLIRNRQDSRILLAEKPSIDYFLIIQDNYSFDSQEVVDNLRKMDCVMAAFTFSSDEFNLSEYLIFEK